MFFTCPVCAEGRFSDRPHDCPGPRVTVHVHSHANSRELVRSTAEAIGVPVATLAAAIEARGGKIEPEGSPGAACGAYGLSLPLYPGAPGPSYPVCTLPEGHDGDHFSTAGDGVSWPRQSPKAASVPSPVSRCTCLCPQLILEGDATEMCPDCYGVRHAGAGGVSPKAASVPREPLDADLDEVQRRLDEEVARRRAGLPPWSGQSVSSKAANALVALALRPMTCAVRIDASSVEAALDSFKASLAAAAAELRSALADQRHGASSHEVAERVRAVADALEGKG